MNSVSQVNNLAQFMNLVSAARTRNSGLLNNAGQAARPRSFQATARPGAMAYSSTRQVMKNDTSAPVESSANPPQATRVLGTKFDAYA